VTATALLDVGSPRTEKGVTSRHLWLAGHEARRVPALVVTPEDASGSRPVVLLGHGAGGSKDDEQMLRIARWLVRREAWAVAIIDGPVHGERQPESGNLNEQAALALAQRATYEAMAVDWQCTLDACAELPDVGGERAAYLGFSMGTVLGIPAVAAEPRIACAVFAIGGIRDGINFLSRSAEQISRPVLLVNQADDELFSREAAFRLYDAIAGPKRIFFYPGPHSGVPREAMERVREFLREHLTGEAAIDAPKGAS
jgi:dienelactone hydrolase